jgi:hypothetical protein
MLKIYRGLWDLYHLVTPPAPGICFLPSTITPFSFRWFMTTYLFTEILESPFKPTRKLLDDPPGLRVLRPVISLIGAVVPC